MNILTIIIAFFTSTVLCIFDDELNKIDWIHQQIGVFTSSPIITNSTIFGITDANLFVGLSTITDQILFRHETYQDAQMVRFQNQIVVGSWQHDFYHLNFYQNGELIHTEFFTSQVCKLMMDYHNGKLLIIFNDNQIGVMGKDYQVSYYQFAKGVDVIKFSSFDDKMMFANVNGEIDIYDFQFSKLKTFKVQSLVKDLKLSKVLLSNGDVYDVSGLKKLNKLNTQVKLMNEDGILLESSSSLGFLEFRNNANELNFELSSSSSQQQPVLYSLLNDDNLIIFTNESIKSIDLETGLEIDNVKLTLDFNNVKRLTVSSSDSDDSIAIVIERDDDVIEFYKNGDLIWSRDESLAKIKDFIIIDELPKTVITEEEILKEEESSLLSAFNYRLWKTIPRLSSLFFKNDDDDDEDKSFKLDYFGLNKKLIILTNSNKLFAFNIEKKQLLWKSQLSNDYTNVIKSPITDGEFYLFDHSGKMIILNTNGDIIKQGSYNLTIDKIHEIDDLILLQTSTLEIILVTNTTTTSVDLDNIYMIGNDDESVYGLKIDIEKNKLVKTWSLPLHDDEELLSIVKREDSNNDHVASIGVVLGDRKVLYKYLVPNLVVVSTYVDEVLIIKLINLINGDILHVVKHDLEFIDKQSFKLIYDENFIIYQYFSFVPTAEQKIIVIDLFESLTPNDHHITTSSSQLDSKSISPAIATRSFNFPHRIRDMIITRTRYNISTKNLIVLLTNGEIISIPKFVISGRRPYDEPTTVEKQEPMMYQYHPNIPINDNYVLTNIHHLQLKPPQHQIQQENTNKLVSVPTNLESTTVICSLELDIYCTRLSPSGEFDVLSHGFGKGQLITTILMLLIGVFIVKPMVDNKRLQAHWIVK